jgi:hypothetical protein
MPRLVLLGLAIAACGSGNPENSPICGFQSLAAANLVLDQLRLGSKTLTQIPAGVEGTVPVRVVGHGTARAIAAQGAEGLVLGYEGEGFPARPGFGLLLVEDSLDTFKGVLVFDLEPPTELPRLGAIASAQATIPLYGLRVSWGAVSSERCPLITTLDTVGGDQ